MARILRKPELKFYEGDVPFTWTFPSSGFPVSAKLAMVGRKRKVTLTPSVKSLSWKEKEFIKNRVIPDLCLFVKIYQARKNHLDGVVLQPPKKPIGTLQAHQASGVIFQGEYPDANLQEELTQSLFTE